MCSSDLVQRLFKEGLIVPVYRAAGRRVSVDEIERRALVDPGFGGHLVSWFSSAGERLPDFITQPALVGAHQFLLEPGRPNADVKVALAYAINLPGSEPQRDLVRAILLCDAEILNGTRRLMHRCARRPSQAKWQTACCLHSASPLRLSWDGLLFTTPQVVPPNPLSNWS